MLYQQLVLVVYAGYYIVLYYIHQGTGDIYGVLQCPQLHPPGYWWVYILCSSSFFPTSPRILKVYTVFFVVLCYISQGTCGIYDVQHCSMLHTTGYWWYILWCITSLYATSPSVLLVYTVNFTVLCYTPQGTGGIYGVQHRSMLHP